MTWHAYYNNRESLPQFNNDGSENKFSLIDQDKLVRFDVNSETGDTVSVDLNYGTITLNDNILTFGIKSKPRLIYFRRNTINTTLGNNVQEKFMNEYVGWQTTTEDGKNKKFVIGIYNGYIEVDYK
jgi:hypothetical protein